MFQLSDQEVASLRFQIGTSSSAHGAFIHMRGLLSSNEAMRKQLEELERKVASHDQATVGIFKTLHDLMSPQRTNAIGFTANIES
jgi:hypothetical protein